MDVAGSKRVFQRLGPGAATASSSGSDNNNNKQQKVCFHWRAGKCSRYPCPYLHRELPTPQQSSMGNGAAATSKRAYGFAADDQYVGGGMRRNSNFNSSWGRQQHQHQQGGFGNRAGGAVKKTEKLCNYWVQGNCSYGDKCRYLHSWSTGDCFSLLTLLEGHEKVIGR